MDLTTFIELVRIYGPSKGIILFLIGIIWYLIKVLFDEDLSAHWRSHFHEVIYKVTGKSKAEKKYMENDISSRIKLTRCKMPFGKDYVPKAIKVEWFKGVEGETSRIKENEIIVCIDPAELQEKNKILLANGIGVKYNNHNKLEGGRVCRPPFFIR